MGKRIFSSTVIALRKVCKVQVRTVFFILWFTEIFWSPLPPPLPSNRANAWFGCYVVARRARHVVYDRDSARRLDGTWHFCIISSIGNTTHKFSLSFLLFCSNVLWYFPNELSPLQSSESEESKSRKIKQQKLWIFRSSSRYRTS